jgi:hypothetical protein
MKQLILVHGDKGGVGKSHVAQFTAAAFREAGHPVTLIDGDAKNPGLYRYLNGKPDPVLRVNSRTAEGFDELINAFLEASGDVLVDLPAGGSDTTEGFLGGGSTAGTIDIESLMQAIGGRLVILFVMDQGRDALVAFADELQRLPKSVTQWIVVRNHHIDAKFDRFDDWRTENPKLVPAIILDMPSLDRQVVETLVTEKMHVGEIGNVPKASMLMKMRAKSAFSAWKAELEKTGLISNG